MVISALRYTLADTDETYDEHLKPIVIGMLTKMLSESDLENRRLALTTFNSAMHNKPELILPALNEKSVNSDTENLQLADSSVQTDWSP